MKDQLASGGGRYKAVQAQEELSGTRELTLSKEARMSMSVTDERYLLNLGLRGHWISLSLNVSCMFFPFPFNCSVHSAFINSSFKIQPSSHFPWQAFLGAL